MKVVKNKVAAPRRQAEFDIEYGQGISAEGCLLDLALEHNIVQKSGSFFSFGDERIGQGRNNVKAYLRENPDGRACARGEDLQERSASSDRLTLRSSRASEAPARASVPMPSRCRPVVTGVSPRRPRNPRRRPRRRKRFSLPAGGAEPQAGARALAAKRLGSMQTERPGRPPRSYTSKSGVLPTGEYRSQSKCIPSLRPTIDRYGEENRSSS